jgi:hypothetical protein
MRKIKNSIPEAAGTAVGSRNAVNKKQWDDTAIVHPARAHSA